MQGKKVKNQVELEKKKIHAEKQEERKKGKEITSTEKITLLVTACSVCGWRSYENRRGRREREHLEEV